MSSAVCMSCVRFCTALQEWPAAVLCLGLSLLQMAVMDYYLIEHLGISHLTWLAFDAVNITLLVIAIYQARSAIQQQRTSVTSAIASGSMGWVCWLIMSISVAAKAVVIFNNFSATLDETATFFGPNTLKTTIAMGSCTFLLLLITQHDAPVGSDGRRYIEELTGTVVFDILDTVDIMEVLFDSDDRDKLWNGLEEFIMAVGVLNLLLPTVPLYTLARSKFGQKKLSVRLIHGHRILLVLAVNVPNLLVRMMLWHGISTGVSPFTLKNILAVSLTFYDIYEHKQEDLEERSEKSKEKANGVSAGKPRNGTQSDHTDGREFADISYSPKNSDSGVGSPGFNNSFAFNNNPSSHPARKVPEDYYKDRDGRGRTFEDSDRFSSESAGSDIARNRERNPQQPRSGFDHNVTSV